MSTGSTLKKFNPIDMSKEDVIALATGREKILATMLDEMKSCVKSQISQHYVLFGPRGIGKSFFIRLLNIHHDKSEEFAESIFIQLPEETDNIRYVADLMDKISNKLEGGFYIDTRPRWEMNQHMWSESKKRLTAALKKIEKENKQHVFIGVENLQDFIPKLDEVENGRMREFLSDFHKVTLIGSSLRPDLDNDYNKKLFQVFKKIDVEPWKADDYIEFYQKKASLSPNQKEQQNQLDISENKIKAIAAFTGGSPRLAVILSSLVLDQKIVETAVLLDNIIDDLTAYYQDLIKDIPPKSKALFDMLIRIGENVTQSELAKAFDPPLEQRTIARSFNWLLDNYYVVFKKQAKGNTKNYFVRDRLFVLYYQKRQVFADQLTSFVGVFVDFLTEYFSVLEWKEQIKGMDLLHPYSKPIMLHYSKRRGLKLDEDLKNEDIKSNIVSDIESKYSKGQESLDIYSTKSKLDLETEKEFNDVMEKAIKYYENGDSKKAILNFEKAIGLNPKDARAYHNLGLAIFEQGDISGANIHFKKAIELDSGFTLAYSSLGYSNFKQGDIDGAITHFKKAIAIDPKYTTAIYNLGNILYYKGDIESAKDHFKKATEINPKDTDSFNNLGSLIFEQGDIEGAILHYKKAIELNPKNAEAYYNLGKGLSKLENNAGAIEHFKKAIELNPTDAIAIIDLGNGLYEQGDIEGAILNYKKAIEINPKAVSAINNLGRILYEQGDVEGAKSLFSKAIESNPNSVYGYTNLGKMISDQGDIKGAIKLFRRALELDPEHALTYYNLGVELYGLKDYEGAIKQFKKAVEFDSEFILAYNNMGFIYNFQKNYNKAIEELRKAIEIDPKFAIAYNNLGIAMYNQGDIEGAKEQYKKAMELDRNFSKPYNNLGVIFNDIGNWKESELWYTKGLKKSQNDLMLLEGLFEIYLIQSKWEDISNYRNKLPSDLSINNLIGGALGEAMNHEKVEPFLLFKETLNFIQTSHPEWLIGFIISLTMHLYTSNSKEMLENLVDELKQEENDNPFLAIILECWEYLQDPENNDIAKLHPDARIAVNKIMELKNMEQD